MFIYVHLPFCLSHCIYCDFYVELKATPDRRRAYLDALKTEITQALGNPAEQTNPSVQTLYLGGGTPALFSATEIGELLAHVASFVPFAPEAEITLEANPEGMASPPQAYRDLGINRLSIGVQSLQPNELKRLSRVHNREQVFQFLKQVQQAGFENISIDLMYGIPEQTMASWTDTLEQTGDLGIQHLSMYGLKVEEGTRLEALLAQGRMTLPPDERTVEMYFAALDLLESQGFERYEISNLALPGHTSRHNLNYWDNGEFWGFGVSAHGYRRAQRYENPRNLEAYLEKPSARAETHDCSPQEQRENALIFGLRKRHGVYLPQLEEQYGFDFDTQYAGTLKRYFEADYLRLEDGWLQLQPKAIPVSNEILATFIE